MDHRLPEAVEDFAFEPMHAAAEKHPVLPNMQVEARTIPAAPVAVPEPERQMRLVGLLVLGKPDIAVDPADRAVDLWIELHARRQGGEARPYRGNECPPRFDIAPLIDAAMGVEPCLLVMRRNTVEEFKGRGGKPPNAGSAKGLPPSLRLLLSEL